MSRFAPIITLDEFKEICLKELKAGTSDFHPDNFSNKIQKDISKIQFDFENWDIGNADYNYDKYPTDHQGFADYPCGYKVLKNGLPVLFVNAGGDWEYPICFCIYYDGKTLRAYIPTDGNVYNKKEKCAYGSECNEEIDTDEITEECNHDAIENDIINRIQIR